MASLNVPILSVISAYHISLEEFQGKIFSRIRANVFTWLLYLTGRRLGGDPECTWLWGHGGQWAVSSGYTWKEGVRFLGTISPQDILISDELVRGRIMDHQAWDVELRWDAFTFPISKPRSGRVTQGADLEPFPAGFHLCSSGLTCISPRSHHQCSRCHSPSSVVSTPPPLCVRQLEGGATRTRKPLPLS